jgi:hypothetical protein
MKITTVASIIGACLLTTNLGATMITYNTPAGASTSGGPVAASASFTTGSGTLQISLSDLLANPTDIAQTISDLEFTLSGGQTTGTLVSSTSTEITVAGNGTATPGGTVSTGWDLNNNVGGGLQLDVLGSPVGPAHLIIGPPGAGGAYTAANGSIAGNGPHNPFLDQTATFALNIPGVTADSTVSSATFSFGTTEGANNVPGVAPSVPDGGSTAALLGVALIGIWFCTEKSAGTL